MQIKKIIDKYHIPVKEVLITSGLISKAGNLITKLGFKGKKLLLVTDEIIYPQIAKKIIIQINSPALECLVLEAPKADEENLLKILNKCEDFALIIGVGSGTINDLCKLASAIKSLPYIIFGTAPSMNGYLSSNSSVLINKHKQTLPAHLPLAVYLDLDLQIKAPKELIKAGIGDSICISTCKFDWLMSHLIFKSDYNNLPFELVKSRHKKFITQNYNLKDKDFIKLLCEILLISGIGMYLSKGSYPASQGEHLIAHYLEMNYPNLVKKYFHGQQIAVTTLTMAEIQEKILQIPHLQIKQYQINSELKTIQKKSFTPKEIAVINQNLKQNWPKIKQKLKTVFIAKNDLLKLYKKFDLPTKPANIGVKSDIYQKAVDNAHLIRNRFTSLDILYLQL